MLYINCCSANLEKIRVLPNLYVLIIQLLARKERYAELGLFVINKVSEFSLYYYCEDRRSSYAKLWLINSKRLFLLQILEPSKEVALQLLESGRQNTQTRKLGLDMLRQLGLHHDYVLLLAQDGYYLEALRYARKYKVLSTLLDPVIESNYVVLLNCELVSKQKLM